MSLKMEPELQVDLTAHRRGGLRFLSLPFQFTHQPPNLILYLSTKSK